MRYARWFATRNACATGDRLSSATAVFIFWIAGIVRSALTAFSVRVIAGPSDFRRLCLTTGATFWNPNTFFGSVRIAYLPVADASDLERLER